MTNYSLTPALNYNLLQRLARNFSTHSSVSNISIGGKGGKAKGYKPAYMVY